ncbi:hypothetical protein H310_03229 [Aphanomyces invadans]|uniref:SAM domain-containing protein n=1 Tax=Aphanomyces invadans TaxID=157072 RepID=A0A024UGE1_9STRA|nr:hypothetical protein H310_03229 [Aphanomyces invadans]ETW05466.1 hypothetical protein H310_03229 [Aphanomyces invadans]|eukprot:XP_008865243.1 hypothetical protein H310_03229 [Aphanomyces invadans]
MGAGTLSKPAGEAEGTDVDFDTINKYLASEIAAIVTGFGAAYEPYGPKIIENGIDGHLLSALGIDEVTSIVETLGVTNAIHAKKIALFFKSFKEKQLGVALPVTSPKLAAPSPSSRSMSSRKVRRTSIGHSVDKQETSEEALAALRASLAIDSSIQSTPVAGSTANPPVATSALSTPEQRDNCSAPVQPNIPLVDVATPVPGSAIEPAATIAPA